MEQQIPELKIEFSDYKNDLDLLVSYFFSFDISDLGDKSRDYIVLPDAFALEHSFNFTSRVTFSGLTSKFLLNLNCAYSEIKAVAKTKTFLR